MLATAVVTALVSATAGAAPSAATFEPRAATADFTFDAAAMAGPRSLDATFTGQDEPDTTPTVAEPFGLAGTEYLMWNAAVGSDLEDRHLARMGVGISYFIDDDISVDFELNGVYFDLTETDDAFGLNANLLLRWHFLVAEDRSWSVYVDGGAGLLLASEEVPQHASNFNFTPQLGAGVSFDVGEDARLFTGIRWFHVSNANVYDENPGVDFALVYVALAFPF